MSEVKEHSVIYLAPACHEEHMQREWCEDDVWSACEECGSGDASVRYNLGADFDRVTAENSALQALLTAADERADVMTTALSRIQFRCQSFVESDWAMAVESVEAVLSIAEAALNPAEGGGDE